MITNSQIDEWIREIEERPASAGQILRAIAARLVELDQWNEELLADNIALRSGSRVDEYESRITALEYQLELLKRRGVEPAGVKAGEPANDAGSSLIVFNALGQILRLAVPAGLPRAGLELGRFPTALDPLRPLNVMAAVDHDDLLFVFDSGRTATLRAGEIPAASAELDWRQAQRLAPRPGEELVAALPVTGLALAEYCVQVSRRACAKLMPKTSFQSLVSRGSIGAGIKRKPDKTAILALCGREEGLALVTREGSMVSLPVSRLPYSVDEVMQLSVSDYIVAGFPFADKSDLVFVTNNGKIIRRDTGWLEPVGSFKSRGQAVFSSARREAGVRLVGAAAAGPGCRCAVLRAEGVLWAYPLDPLLESGAIETGAAPGELAAFVVFMGAA